MKKTKKILKKNTKMIAHRGLSGLEKENTMASFIAAANCSYYGIECDIHPTIDGFYAVVHDDNLQRLAGSDLVVRENTLQKLQSIYLIDNYDQKKHCHLVIPRLEQYLKTCQEYQKKAIIEFKHYFNDNQLQDVLDIVESFNYLKETIFISFEISNLIRLRKKNNNLKMQFLCSKYSEEVFNTCLSYRFDLDIHHSALTKDIIDLFHQANLEINAWTVDQEEDALRLIDWGIDYLTTNILE